MTVAGNVFVIYRTDTGIPVMVLQDSGERGVKFNANYWVVGIVKRHNKRSKIKWDWNGVPIHDSIVKQKYRGRVVSSRMFDHSKFKDEDEK